MTDFIPVDVKSVSIRGQAPCGSLWRVTHSEAIKSKPWEARWSGPAHPVDPAEDLRHFETSKEAIAWLGGKGLPEAEVDSLGRLAKEATVAYQAAYAEANGYPKDGLGVSLWGATKVYPQHCRLETSRECGCGFGQCARGLIY